MKNKQNLPHSQFKLNKVSLVVTPSPVASKVYEISDMSYYHMYDIEEDIQISVTEEKLSFHSMETFSSDSSILNYVHSLPVIVSENKEEFDCNFICLSLMMLLVCQKIILWIFWK